MLEIFLGNLIQFTLAKEGPAGDDDNVGEAERSLTLEDNGGISLKLPHSGN